MTTPILLPPLPDEFLMHPTQGECYTADQLRARDLEVAQLVLGHAKAEAYKIAAQYISTGAGHSAERAGNAIGLLEVRHE